MSSNEQKKIFLHPPKPSLELRWLRQAFPLPQTAATMPDEKPATTFPFDKLPPELQLMIIRHAMPQHGLRPLPDPLRASIHDSSAYVRHVEGTRHERRTVRNMLYVNRWMSSEALKLLYKEVLFRIDIEPESVRFLGQEITKEQRFRHYPILEDYVPFKYMRHFEFRISFEPGQYVDSLGHIDAFQFAVKEWLRMICDAMSGNRHIQELKVIIPGLCVLTDDDALAAIDLRSSPSWCAPQIIDMLEPLKRLRVRTWTLSIPHYDAWLQRPSFHGRKPLCESWMRTLLKSLGPLQGEPLSQDEATWKQLKRLYLPPYGSLRRDLEIFTAFEITWRCLNRRFHAYDRAVGIVQQMLEPYRGRGMDAEHPIIISK
ncbi:MAG: hypothetical protein Q9219_003796 [cf. Caloplaca sp. 3 TL-2023]